MVLLALAVADPAQAQQFKPCERGVRIQCAEIPVPLDRSGAVQGTVRLAATRMPARRSPRAGTVLLVPGGPGQSGAELLLAALALGAEMPTHDFVVFDPRGTGDSGRLRCKALARGAESTAPARCAAELGPRRGYYRSYDSAEDIESVRRALGSPQLTLYSISYGARVAGEYVRRHPGAVVRQIMDSPSAITGTDPFSREVLASQPRVLNTLRRGGARTVARLATRLGRRSLRGRVYRPSGKPARARASQADLFTTLIDADLDPVLRGQIPAAATAALRGDPAPLLRLAAAGGGADDAEAGLSVPAFLATTCSEAPLPWDTAAPASRAARIGQTSAALRALGPAPFAPFAPAVVADAGGLIAGCAGWPAVPKPPPLPAGTDRAAVPTLVLEGAEDTRTPLEQGRQIASTYSPSQVLTIPHTGHSVLGTDLSDCTADAVTTFITRGTAPARCPARPRPAATPVVRAFPRNLRSLRGSLRARSIAAGPLTVADAIRRLSSGAATARVGGLRGGYARVRRGRVVLTRYEFLAGVRVTGTVRVSSSGAVTGQVRIRGGGALRVLQTYRRARIASRAAGDPVASAASVTRWTPPPLKPRLRPQL